jgi:hypothetical protein
MTKTGERRLENNQTGFKLATSVGGVSTGERGDRILLDDPHNVIKAESDTEREETVRFVGESISNRLASPRLPRHGRREHALWGILRAARSTFLDMLGSLDKNFASQNATRIAADRRNELRACLASRLGALATAEIGGCGAIARDRANRGNERSGASRRTTQTLGESARASKDMSPLSTTGRAPCLENRGVNGFPP